MLAWFWFSETRSLLAQADLELTIWLRMTELLSFMFPIPKYWDVTPGLADVTPGLAYVVLGIYRHRLSCVLRKWRYQLNFFPRPSTPFLETEPHYVPQADPGVTILQVQVLGLQGPQHLGTLDCVSLFPR